MPWADIDSLNLQAEAESSTTTSSMRKFTEHESVPLGARRGVPLAARSRYHGMVSLEKMRIIVAVVRW